MRKCVGLVAVVVLLFAGVSCTQSDRGRVQAARESTLASFKPVSFARTGGRYNADEHVVITSDGKIESRTAYGAAQGKLSEFQILQLSRAFEDWDKLQPSYPPARPNPDAATVTIQYGNKTVTASEASEGLPEGFTTARERIQAIARDLPRRG